jgi:hypothetical protein
MVTRWQLHESVPVEERPSSGITQQGVCTINLLRQLERIEPRRFTDPTLIRTPEVVCGCIRADPEKLIGIVRHSKSFRRR